MLKGSALEGVLKGAEQWAQDTVGPWWGLTRVLEGLAGVSEAKGT